MQGLLDLRDENFKGAGIDIGLTLSGGSRNFDASADYSMKRLANGYLSFHASTFFRTFDSYLFGNAPGWAENTWRRNEVGEYRDTRYGASAGVSGQFERLGNAEIEGIYENVRLTNLLNAMNLEERYNLVIVRGSTVVDSKDSYPFATRGVGLNLSYEFAVQALGSDLSYNEMKLMYESYVTWGGVHTFHPKFTMDFADRTLPLSQQFRFGGREMMFGTREDDQRGRQLILMNIEYRYALPVKILFDSYLRVRYDMGSISALPEEIKFSSLHHGVGMELALQTPVGPAAFGAGKSFYFDNLSNGALQQGPLVWYFQIGYQLP
jgi:outer membrane protein assembly factor BamA